MKMFWRNKISILLRLLAEQTEHGQPLGGYCMLERGLGGMPHSKTIHGCEILRKKYLIKKRR